MKAYKGFTKIDDGRLMCHDFQYEPGKTYKHEGEIKLCETGFHACYELYQVWSFYPNNGNNVFYEVECGGDIIERKDGSGKFVCSEITLVQPVDMDNVALFSYAWSFYDGFARIWLDGKCNFINTEGKLSSEQWFDDAWNFYDGFARVRLGGKYNFINTKGKLLSEQWFDDVWSFSDGFAEVEIDGKVKRINKKGKIV